MLITFKSKAAGDVIMFGEVASRLLQIIGKDPQDKKGIVTTEQLPDAIARLEQAITVDKAASKPTHEDEDGDEDDSRKGMTAAVSLAQRAIPLLDLFRSALAHNTHVIWES